MFVSFRMNIHVSASDGDGNVSFKYTDVLRECDNSYTTRTAVGEKVSSLVVNTKALYQRECSGKTYSLSDCALKVKGESVCCSTSQKSKLIIQY